MHGIRTDSVPYLVEHADFLDEPLVDSKAAGTELDHDSLKHIYTMNQPESYKIVKEFRDVLDSYTQKGGPTRYVQATSTYNIHTYIHKGIFF